MKIVAVTQARVGSTRLPNKILKTVGNKTLLEIHINRILKSKFIDSLYVATTNEVGVENIISICKNLKVPYYQGSIDDVLDRFYRCVENLEADYIIRLTSDCPLMDSEVIDEMIEFAISCPELDYISNTLNPTFPDGLDIEIFKFSALKSAWKNAKKKHEREHVTPFIWEQKNTISKKLNVYSFEQNVNESTFRLTLDYQDDYELISQLIKAIGENRRYKDYVNYIEQSKKLKYFNSHHKRNESYTSE